MIKGEGSRPMRKKQRDLTALSGSGRLLWKQHLRQGGRTGGVGLCRVRGEHTSDHLETSSCFILCSGRQ